MTGRRFPAPWHADKIPGGYVVRDANGQAPVSIPGATVIAHDCAIVLITCMICRRSAAHGRPKRWAGLDVGLFASSRPRCRCQSASIYLSIFIYFRSHPPLATLSCAPEKGG